MDNKFIFYSADIRGEASNCLYPNRIEVVDAKTLADAVSHDYVCAEYKDNYRNIDNFIKSNVLAFDCDNDHSDDPKDWIKPQDLRLMFPDVSFLIHYSRNNMKPKKGKAPRLKFHVFMLMDEITKAEDYKALKEEVSRRCPYFDDNAMDAARFFFGTEKPEVELYLGTKTINQYLKECEEAGSTDSNTIEEGSRNNTLYKFAVCILKRFGICEKSYNAFLEKSKECNPPLDERELSLIWYSAKKFYEGKVVKNKDYVSPEKYQGNLDLKPEDYSDIGQAKAFIHGYKAKLIYTEATDYLYYNGQYWDESKQLSVGVMEDFLDKQLADAESQIQNCLQQLMQTGLQEQDLFNLNKKDVADFSEQQSKLYAQMSSAMTYKAFVMKRRDMKYINSALSAAIPMVLHDVNDLDKDCYLLNTPNGTVDLRSGLMKDHDQNDLITKITAVSPSEEGKEIWLSALDTFFCKDKDLIDYVQEAVGLASIGKVLKEMMIIAHGDGRNGKSTFWNTIAKVLGTYSGAISADALTVGCKRNVKPEMAELKGKRIAIAAELEEGTRLNTAIVKQLSSTDKIHAEKKYKAPFQFEPSHMVVLYTNHLPRVGAIDAGTWRRLIVIPFNAVIEGKSDIKNYADFLFKNAGGYILSWIIEGAIKASRLDGKIVEPQIVVEAIKKYKEANDWIHIFLDECCDIGEAYTQKSGELFTEYRAYCMRTGEFPRSTTDFYSAIEMLGFERKKTNKGYLIKGLQLKKEENFI